MSKLNVLPLFLDLHYIYIKYRRRKVINFVRFASGVDFDDRRKPTVSRMKHMVVNHNGMTNHSSMPHTVVVPKGRKIKSSMRQLEQQQDELFEL